MKINAALLCGVVVTTSVAMIDPASARRPEPMQTITSPRTHSVKISTGLLTRFCSQEAGNPYDEQTDYMAWSSWRQLGAWDSRHDCP